MGDLRTQLIHRDRAEILPICRKTSYIAKYDPNIALSQYELSSHCFRYVLIVQPIFDKLISMIFIFQERNDFSEH